MEALRSAMSVPSAFCPVHGQFDVPNFLGVGGTAFFRNCSLTCPICDSSLPIPDGRYDFVGKIVKAVSQPGVSRDSVVALYDTLQAVRQNVITPESANKTIQQITSEFSDLLQFTNENAGSLTLLITVVGLILAFWAQVSTERSSKLQHADAQQQLQVSQMIYEELKRLPVEAVPQRIARPPKPELKQVAQTRTPATDVHVNRHDRRKAESLDRRRLH